VTSRSASLHSLAPERPWGRISVNVKVGKDILELLSTGMYVDPMSIYREYVQNAADAIDDARGGGILAADERGRIQFDIDTESRNVRIRDNGIGVPSAQFVERLTAVGASHKRGRNARGFRGVGRLAGIGYCQELLFRSRAAGETSVSEIRWDCRALKHVLRSEDGHKYLSDTILEAVTARQLSPAGFPDRFFEVELRSIVRHKNDQLLNPTAINAYLAQVAPVPFAPDFSYGPTITRALQPWIKLGEIEITLPGMTSPVYRPHRDHIEIGGGKRDSFSKLEIINIPGMNGDTAALGWVLHHGYTGALPGHTLQRGLRLRVGNLQIGNERILDDLFTETRFNSWSVGEIHIIEGRVLPNGRRDNFEQNAHLLNVLSHLAPVARELSKRCRDSSIRRNRWREFLRQIDGARERLGIIKQGALSKSEQVRLLREVHAAIAEAERLMAHEFFAAPQDVSPQKELQRLKRDVLKASGEDYSESPLAHLTRTHRQAYQKVFSLIYECAPNRSVAKAIIDRVMARL